MGCGGSKEAYDYNAPAAQPMAQGPTPPQGYYAQPSPAQIKEQEKQAKKAKGRKKATGWAAVGALAG